MQNVRFNWLLIYWIFVLLLFGCEQKSSDKMSSDSANVVLNMLNDRLTDATSIDVANVKIVRVRVLRLTILADNSSKVETKISPQQNTITLKE